MFQRERSVVNPLVQIEPERTPREGLEDVNVQRDRVSDDLAEKFFTQTD